MNKTIILVVCVAIIIILGISANAQDEIIWEGTIDVSQIEVGAHPKVGERITN
jgi:hypothetical protein